MQEVIDDLLKAEEQAKKIIDEAQEEARRIRTDCENEYGQKLKEVKNEMQEYLQIEIEKARQSLLAEQAKLIDLENNKAEDLWVGKRSLVEKTISELVKMVVQTDYE